MDNYPITTMIPLILVVLSTTLSVSGTTLYRHPLLSPDINSLYCDTPTSTTTTSSSSATYPYYPYSELYPAYTATISSYPSYVYSHYPTITDSTNSRPQAYISSSRYPYWYPYRSPGRILTTPPSVASSILASRPSYGSGNFGSISYERYNPSDIVDTTLGHHQVSHIASPGYENVKGGYSSSAFFPRLPHTVVIPGGTVGATYNPYEAEATMQTSRISQLTERSVDSDTS